MSIQSSNDFLFFIFGVQYAFINQCLRSSLVFVVHFWQKKKWYGKKDQKKSPEQHFSNRSRLLFGLWICLSAIFCVCSFWTCYVEAIRTRRWFHDRFRIMGACRLDMFMFVSISFFDRCPIRDKQPHYAYTVTMQAYQTHLCYRCCCDVVGVGDPLLSAANE